MKKIFCSVIVCSVVLLVLSGCMKLGVEESTTLEARQESTVIFKQTEPAVRQPSLQVLAEALAATGITDWDGSYKNLTVEQRTALEQYFSHERREDIRFTDEGVLYVDDTKTPLSEPWAENSLLSLAPEPDFGNVFASWVQPESISVSYTDVEELIVEAYITNAKASGFNKVTAERTSVCCGMVFEANNKDGVRLSLVSRFAGAQSVTTVTVSAP